MPPSLAAHEGAIAHFHRRTGRRAGVGIAGLAGLPLPFVAHWEGDHYVVVTGIGRRGVSVMDPAVGRRRFDADTYLRGATGVVLTFGGSARR